MSRARFARWLLVIWALTGCASTAAPPGGQTGPTVTPDDPARPRVEVTTEAGPVPSAPAGPVGPEPVAPTGPLSSLSVGPAQPAEPPPVAPPTLTAPGAPSPKVAQPPVSPHKVAARQSAVQLKHVQVEQQADSVTVKLWTTGIPSYSASLIDAPTRLVIDLTGTAYAWDRSRVNPDVPPIREIRGSQWKAGTARIVLELTRKVGYRIEPSAEGLSIIFDSLATAVRTDAPKPTASKPAPKAVAVVAKAEAPQAVETPKTETPVVTPAGPRSNAAAPARRQIVFNFDNADVELVIQAAAEIVGFNYVLAPGVRGRTVTVKTLGKISADEVFAVLLTILDVNGMAAVRSGNLYRIIPREGAPQTSIKTVVGRDVDPAQPGDEIVTQVVPLGFLGAPDAVTLLRPLVPPGGALGAHPESNLLIITDTVANIRRLLDIVRMVDVEGAHSELRIIPLMHADAQELAQLLTQVFASGRLSTGLSGVGAGVPVPVPPPPPAPGTPPATPRPPLAGAGTPPGSEAPLIVPEPRSNSLVVHARRRDIETIRRLVEKLDVDIYGGRRVFIYFVENTKARDLATTLDAIYGSDRGPSITGVQPTSRTPSISSPYGAPTTTAPVAPLAPSPSPLSSLSTPGSGGRLPIGSFPGLAGEGGPPVAEVRIIADEVTNAIIVPTYPRLWKEIEETIKKLDKMPRQVLIEVLAAEVTLTDATKLGLEWAIRTGRFDLISSPTGLLPGRPPQSLIPLGVRCRWASAPSPSRPISSLPRSTRWPARTRSTYCPTRPS